jgi:peptide/nickel transport system permease protein
MARNISVEKTGGPDPEIWRAPLTATPGLFVEAVRTAPGAVSVFILLFLFLVSTIVPALLPHDPLAINPANQFAPPSISNLMGTDELGRDVLSRLVWAVRNTASIALGAVLVAGLTGVSAGIWAAYVGQWASTVIMRVFDVLLAIPSVVLGIALVAFLGSSWINIIIAVGFGSIPQFGRMAYATTLEQREREYVLASVALGARASRIMFRSIFPNLLPYLIVQFTLSVAAAALLEASLSFLGLGIQPPYPSLGQMLFVSQRFLYQAPWYGVVPGLFLTLFVYALNSAGDGLKQVLSRRSAP